MLLSLWILACAPEAPTPAAVPPAPAPVAPVAASPDPARLLPPDPTAVGGTPKEMPVNGTTPGMPQVDTLLGKVDGILIEGDWTSKPCEGRNYARNIRFETNRTYAAIDLVSPCPVGTECAWSGMTTFGGKWTIENRELLTRELGAGTAEGGPHPTKFVATMEGTLIENRCVYEKGLTVPDGYEAARVTPQPVK